MSAAAAADCDDLTLSQIMNDAEEEDDSSSTAAAAAAPATPTRAAAASAASAPASCVDSPSISAMLDEMLGSPLPPSATTAAAAPASPPTRRASASNAVGRPASPMTDAADSAVASIPAVPSSDPMVALERFVVTPLPPDRSSSNASSNSPRVAADDEATGIGDGDTEMQTPDAQVTAAEPQAEEERKVLDPAEPLVRVQIPTPLPPDPIARTNSLGTEVAAAASRSPPLASRSPVVAAAASAPSAADEEPFFPAPAPIPAGFQLGFSTGGGKKLTVSAAALRAAEAKMKRAAADAEASDSAAAAPASSAFAAPVAVRAAASKRSSSFYDDDDSGWPGGGVADSASAAAAAASIPANFSLGFSTGGGKKLAVSDAALRAAEAKMRRAAEEADKSFGAADSDANGHDSASAATAASIPADFQLGFSTGAGRAVAISAAALKQAQERSKRAEAEAEAMDGDAKSVEAAAAAAPKPFSAKPFTAPAPFKRSAAAVPSAVPMLITPRRAHHPLPSLPLPDHRSECSEDPTPPSSAASASAVAITADALLMDDTHSSSKPVVAFAPDALREAREFMEKNEADAFGEMTAVASATAVSMPLHPAAKSKEELAMALMEEFEANLEAKTSEPSEGAVAASTSATNASAPALLSPPSGSVTPSASKRRKSNFSSSLPMPVDEDSTTDDIINESPPRQPEKTSMQTPQSAPAASTVALVQTPMAAAAAARPPITPQSMPPPSGPPASRKRRGAAFVSPRVATKPVLALTSSLQQQPNLLAVNRAATTPQQQQLQHPANGYAAAGGFKQSVQGAMQQLMPQFPVLPGMPALPLSAVVPPSEKVSLRTFSARCDAKLAVLAAQPEADLMWPAQTSIPAESITSVNAGSVLFVPPLHPNDLAVPQSFAPSLSWLDVRAQLLAAGCPAALCSISWVRTQYRWIVWKLASYDRRFGAALAGGPACTFQRVVAQCLQRYDREQNQIKQPAIRRILEGDESAGKYLVLVVAQVILPAKTAMGTGAAAAAAAPSVADDSGVIPARPAGCDVELSDGWYSIWAKLDPQLHYQLTHAKIRVGHKLRIWGAALEGPQPTTPLENSATFLKLHINGVRRARFDAKLGVQRRCAFLVSMASLRPDGGPAPAMRVVVSRQYPVVYMHPPTPDEMPAARASAPAAAAASPSSQSAAAPDAAAAPKVRKLHCNQRAHDTRMAAHVKLCDKRMENLRRAFEDRRAKDKQQATTIEEQQAEDEEWQQERAELEAEMQDVCKQVIPYLKLHLCEVTTRRGPDGKLLTDAPLCWSGQCCLFTVWRPGDEHLELLVPGKELIIYGFTVHARYRGPRGGGVSSAVIVKDPANTPPHPHCTHASSQNLQLSTTRQTNIVPRALAKLQGAVAAAPHAAVVPLRTEFLRSPLWMRPGDLWSLPRQGEFDLVCVVLFCGDDVDAEAQAQQRAGGRGWSKRRRLLCAGLSGDMLLVELFENKETLFFGASPATPVLMQMENLQYQRFEKKLNLHTASATALTLFKPRGPVQIASTDKLVAAASAASHALFAHPSLTSFQSWVSTSTSALVWRTLVDLVKRMLDGRWNGDQTSSFNKEEFGALLSCPVNGQLLPLTTAAATVGTVSLSLTPLLTPPSVETVAAAPVSTAVDDAMSDAKEGIEKGAEDASSAAPAAPVPKKKPASLLVTGSHKPAPAAASGAAIATIDDPILADDCLAVAPSSATSSSSVCYHPSHSLGYLLDASHWSMQLCLDDGTGGRWPLQLNSRAFRRVMELTGKASEASVVAEPHPLRDSLLHLFRTGEVPILALDPISGTEEVLMIALSQSRRRVWEHVLGLFQLQHDEAHQSQQLADLIMLLLSHSSVLPLREYAEGLSVFLSSVSPIWSTALHNSPLPCSPAVGGTPSPPPPHVGAATLLSPPLLATRLAFSPTHPDEMRVRISPAPTAAAVAVASSDVQPMDTEEKQQPADVAAAADPMPLSADSTKTVASSQEPLDSVQLSAAQLSHLQLMLAHVHGAADLTPAIDGTSTTASASPPLFFFTPAEWRTLCELLFSSLSRPTLSFHLAECERHLPLPMHGSLTHRVTSVPFRSVFIPQPENIAIAGNKASGSDGHTALAAAAAVAPVSLAAASS